MADDEEKNRMARWQKQNKNLKQREGWRFASGYRYTGGSPFNMVRLFMRSIFWILSEANIM